jgi:hypothetical protein
MSIDIERLKVDAAYFDEVAPEGATHYSAETEEQFAAWWVNPDGEIGMMDATLADKEGTWRESLFFDERTKARAIPRPAKRSREWDVNGGSTPCSLVDDHPIRRIGELGNQVHNLGCEWQADENISDALGEIAFKLWEVEKQVRLRTKEQRLRDELARLIEENWINDDGAHSGKSASAAILAKYELKERTQ